VLGLSGVLWQGHTLLDAYVTLGGDSNTSFRTGALLCIATAYLWLVNRLRRNNDDVVYESTLVALVMAAGGFALIVGACTCNPWLVECGVGNTPIFNALWLIYGIPWLLLALISRRLPLFVPSIISVGLRVIAIFAELLFAVGLVRQVYHGSVFLNADMVLSERTWISAVMGLYGALLLWIGIANRSKTCRLSSLAILLLTALKVFLGDLGSLEGVYRFASFFGLGVALMTIGYIYQKTATSADEGIPSSDDRSV